MQRGSSSDLNQQLHSAVKEKDAATVEALLDQCRRGYQESLNLGAALCRAIQNKDIEIILLLLRANADIRYVSTDGRRAIHFAILTGNTEIVKRILGAGSSINVVDSEGKAPIHCAVEKGDEAMVQIALKEGSSTRCRTNKEGETPLHMAARMGNAGICKLILARGGGVNFKSRREATSLHVAVRAKHFEIINLLCENGADLEQLNAKGQTALLLAVELSSAEMTRKLLTYGANTNARDMRGRTCMHYLSMSIANEVHLEIAKLLIAAGIADTNSEDVDRYTPLHYAAFKGNISFLKMMLSLGVEVNKYYAWRLDTPLNMAVSNRQMETVKLLIDAGVDVTKVDGRLTRVTALHKAMITRYPRLDKKLELVELLIRHGADLNALTARDHTPLEDCVFYSAVFRDSSLPILMRLVSAGAALATPRYRHDPKSSPLCWLTWHGSIKAAHFLVAAGWNLQHEQWIWLPGKDEEATNFLIWLQEMARTPPSLRQITRSTLRQYLVEQCSGNTDISPYVSRLPIPILMKKFLMLQPEMDEFSDTPVHINVS